MVDDDRPCVGPVEDDGPERVDHLATRDLGEDDNPYEDVDIGTLPDWWRTAIEEHRRYGLRPYRPPVFADGALKYGVVQQLEDELGITIHLLNSDVEGDWWEVRVDGSVVGHVLRTRDPGGYSVYEIESDEFEDLVRSAPRE